jgi:protein-tyrosine phosphatase
MRQIVPHPLWLGHIGDARNLRTLFGAGIAALVDLAREEPPQATHRELIYCRFPIEDGNDNPPALLRLAVQTIAGLIVANIPTLVFCGAGMSRTPALAAAALAVAVGGSHEEWLERLKQIGPADVSPGLWQEVRALCQALRGRNCDKADVPAPIRAAAGSSERGC